MWQVPVAIVIAAVGLSAALAVIRRTSVGPGFERPTKVAILRCMGLDESKLEELTRWGQALRKAGSEESVAAGRAILMLIEELERLRLKLRLAGVRADGAAVADTEIDPETEEAAAAALHERLQRVLSRNSEQTPEARPESVEETGPPVQLEREAASARSWIETLRRQK